MFRTTPACVTGSVPSADMFLGTVAIDDEVVGRDPGFGGCGKAPMLIVLRTGLPGVSILAIPRADPDLKLGISGVDDAAVRALDGGRSLEDECGVLTARLFLGGFVRGIGGRADVGGSPAGREGTGMVVGADTDITDRTKPPCNWPGSQPVQLSRS